MTLDGSAKSDLYVSAGLLAFAAAFLVAVSWQILESGPSRVDRELGAIAARVIDARDCGMPETAISQFVKARLDMLHQQHPGIGYAEILGGLLDRVGAERSRARQAVVDCVGLTERLANH